MKRMLAWLLTLCMLLSCFPMSLAEELAAEQFEVFEAVEEEEADFFEEEIFEEEEEPAEEIPAEETPAEEAPAEETPAEEAPVEETPAEEAPAEEIPAEEAPVEEAPVEEIPAEEAPVEEIPVEEIPVEEIPAEEAPYFEHGYAMLARRAELFADEAMTESVGKLAENTLVYVLARMQTEETDVLTVLYGAVEAPATGYVLADALIVPNEEALAEVMAVIAADNTAVSAELEEGALVVTLPIAVFAAEEAPSAEDMEIELKANWYEEPEITRLVQTANGKVQITFTTPGYAPSYIIEDYAYRTGKTTRTVVTKKNTATLSVKDGWHDFYVIPCSTANGKGSLGYDSDMRDIYVYDQRWRKAGTIDKIQLLENYYIVEDGEILMPDSHIITLEGKDSSTAYWFDFGPGIEIRTIQWEVRGKVYELSYDAYDWEFLDFSVSNKSTDKPIDPSGFKMKSKKTDKGITYLYSCGIPIQNDLPAGTKVPVRYCISHLNNEDEWEVGPWSKDKVITINESWTKAPKITSAAQYSAVKPEISLSFTYQPTIYEMTNFRIDDTYTDPATKKKVTDTYNCSNIGSWQNGSGTATWNCKVPGSHTVKLTPIMNGYQGKSVSKTIKVDTAWEKKKIKVTATQTDDDEVLLSWPSLNGVDGYVVSYRVKSGKTSYDLLISDTKNSSITVNDVPIGANTFVVVPHYKGMNGTQNTVKITTKELWKLAPKALNGSVIDSERGTVRLTWTHTGSPDYYELWNNKKELITRIYDTDQQHVADVRLAQGAYNLTLRPVKNGVYGAYSAAKKITYGYAKNPVYRAYVVGNTYPNTSSALPGCGVDALGVANMLRNTKNGTKYAVTMKTDRTASQIFSDIRSTFAGAVSTDVSLFYYSGHGRSKTGELIGNDFYYFTFKQLRDELDKVPGKKIVILDSCYSGNAINKAAGEQGDVTQEDLDAYTQAAMDAFAPEHTKSGELKANDYFVITAASKSQTSAEYTELNLNKKFGLFSWAFNGVCGWDELYDKAVSNEADANNDGRFTLNEVYTATCNRIKAFAGDLGLKSYQSTKVNPEKSDFLLFAE